MTNGRAERRVRYSSSDARCRLDFGSADPGAFISAHVDKLQLREIHPAQTEPFISLAPHWVLSVYLTVVKICIRLAWLSRSSIMDDGIEQVTSAGRRWHYKFLKEALQICIYMNPVLAASAGPSETRAPNEEIFISSFSPQRNWPVVERLRRFGAKAASNFC